MKMFKIEFHESLFDKYAVCFSLEFCAYIYLFYTFSVLQDNVGVILIIWTYYLEQDALTKWCMDVTYNWCVSFWVQVLH